MWDFSRFEKSVALETEQGEQVTYASLSQLTSELSEKIPPRSLVLLLCQNSFGSLLGYVSCINNKVVPILLKDSLDRDTLQHFLNSYQPDMIYLPDNQVPDLDYFNTVHSQFGYSLLKSNRPYNPTRLSQDLALLLTTSGSTGSPKLVRISYQNLQSNTKSIVEYLEMSKDDRAITTLPMNYTYGLSVINSHLAAGARLTLSTKALLQKEFWQQVNQSQITTLSGVPYTYEILSKIGFFKMNLPSLKTLTQAGGKLPLKLHEKFASWARDNQKRFIVMYGQTEATARMTYLPSHKAVEKAGSIGIAIPGGELSLVDDRGQTIEGPDTPGELVYSGPNVALGYADSISSLILPDEFKGVLHTGDLAKRDADGFFYIVGRKKRFLKIFGNRVNLDEVEHLIREKFNISECACAGYDDRMFIFICDGSLSDRVLTSISQMTNLHPSAFKVVVLAQIPKNDAGKTLYSELEPLYG